MGDCNTNTTTGTRVKSSTLDEFITTSTLII